MILDPLNNREGSKKNENDRRQGKPHGRREFLKGAAKAAALGSAAMLTGCGIGLPGSNEAF
jgi:hypothetical protein